MRSTTEYLVCRGYREQWAVPLGAWRKELRARGHHLTKHHTLDYLLATRLTLTVQRSPRPGEGITPWGTIKEGPQPFRTWDEWDKQGKTRQDNELPV